MKSEHKRVIIDLPFALTNGNHGQGRTWFRTDADRKQVEKLLLAKYGPQQPLDCPCEIHITRVLGKGQRKWDPDSILRGNAKQLIDGLVSMQFIRDDSPKWVSEVRGFQDDSNRSYGPSVLVELFPHPEKHYCEMYK